MKEVEKIENVSDFIPSDLGLFIWTNGKIYFNNKVIYDKKPNAVYFYEGVFFIVESNWNDSVYIDSISELKIQHKGIGGMICFIDRTSMLRNIWNDDYTKSTRQKINLKTGYVVWETGLGNPFIVDDYFFGIIETKLCRVNADSGEPTWQLDLPEIYGSYSVNGEEVPIDLQRYIGLYNNSLYIKAGSKLIIGVNIESGKEVYNYEYAGENLVLDNLCLDRTNGLIFSIGSSEYFELNLSTHLAAIKSIKEEVQKHDIETTRIGSWEDNIVYFWEGGANPKFGVFDRANKQIKFVHSVDVSGYPAIRDVKHKEGKIYVLGGDNSLHIFDEIDHPV